MRAQQAGYDQNLYGWPGRIWQLKGLPGTQSLTDEGKGDHALRIGILCS